MHRQPRFVALACLGFVVSMTARAQADEPLDTSRHEAHYEKIAGATLSGLGFGLNALGTGLLIAGVKVPGSCVSTFGMDDAGPCGPSPSPAERSQAHFADSLFLGGVAVSITSYALIAVGIPIWHAGARRERLIRRGVSADSGIGF